MILGEEGGGKREGKKGGRGLAMMLEVNFAPPHQKKKKKKKKKGNGTDSAQEKKKRGGKGEGEKEKR